MQNIIEELKARGLLAQESHEGKLGEVLGQEKIAFYAGFDPTADSLHVGSLALIITMARLAAAGHKPVCLVGGATGMVGDPSGRTEMRQMMSPETLANNYKGLSDQVRKLLKGHDVEFVNNLDWFRDVNYLEFLQEYGAYFKVNEMIKNETYRERLESEQGLTFFEFNYLLLQSVDYLHLHDTFGCRLQIGGTDQWGNIIAGVDLIRRKREKEVYAFTIPLITTSDGKKMGKSMGGAVWLEASKYSPFDFYQYWINVDDRDVGRFLKIFTFLPLEEVAELEKLEGAEIKKAKEVLAYEVTKFIHGEAEADKAKQAALELFSGAGASSEAVPTVEIDLGERKNIVDVLVETGLVESKTKARNLVESGGVYVDDVVVPDLAFTLKKDKDFVLIRLGKKRYTKVVFK
ncbi:MAG: tyrosine--tRNA ligase [Candidatus Paceibacterota bacterium]|jgi:tyrosyl-tRNA synthetase